MSTYVASSSYLKHRSAGCLRRGRCAQPQTLQRRSALPAVSGRRSSFREEERTRSSSTLALTAPEARVLTWPSQGSEPAAHPPERLPSYRANPPQVRSEPARPLRLAHVEASFELNGPCEPMNRSPPPSARSRLPSRDWPDRKRRPGNARRDAMVRIEARDAGDSALVERPRRWTPAPRARRRGAAPRPSAVHRLHTEPAGRPDGALLNGCGKRPPNAPTESPPPSGALARARRGCRRCSRHSAFCRCLHRSLQRRSWRAARARRPWDAPPSRAPREARIEPTL